MTSIADFDIAKSVADLLKDIEKDRQGRILRWVSESLGIEPSHPATPASPPPGGPPPGGHQVDRVGTSTNIKSFIETKDPKSDNQFAAAVAYFYRFEAPLNERKDAITPEELQEATRLAGRKRLGDPGKTLRNAKDMGYLDSVDRGKFAVNSVGENLVAMTLPGEARSSKPTKRAGAKKR